MQGRDIREAPISAQHWGTKERHCVAPATTATSITPLTSPISHKMITDVWEINKCLHPPHHTDLTLLTSQSSVCMYQQHTEGVCLHLKICIKVSTNFCKKNKRLFWIQQSSVWSEWGKALQHNTTFGPFMQQIPKIWTKGMWKHAKISSFIIYKILVSRRVWAQCSCFYLWIQVIAWHLSTKVVVLYRPHTCL